MGFAGDCVLLRVKDIGPSETYVEENGFVATLDQNNNTWELYTTPNTSYVVPETVDGKPISTIFMDFISGEPTFTKYYDLTIYDMAAVLERANVVITDNSVLAAMGYDLGQYFKIVDLTGCGDNIDIPNEILTGSACQTIYVTSVVKAKYPDNSKVVVPES